MFIETQTLLGTTRKTAAVPPIHPSLSALLPALLHHRANRPDWTDRRAWRARHQHTRPNRPCWTDRPDGCHRCNRIWSDRANWTHRRNGDNRRHRPHGCNRSNRNV